MTIDNNLFLRFREEALATHARVCVNVFGKQRKATKDRAMDGHSVSMAMRDTMLLRFSAHPFPPPPQPHQATMSSFHIILR